MTKRAAGPYPRPLGVTAAGLLTVDNIDQYKRVLCVSYAKCLTEAALAKWPNFHCNECDAFNPMPKEALITEAEALKERLFVLHTQKP